MDLDISNPDTIVDLKDVIRKARRLLKYIHHPEHSETKDGFELLAWDMRLLFRRFHDDYRSYEDDLSSLDQNRRKTLKLSLLKDVQSLISGETKLYEGKKRFSGVELEEADPAVCFDEVTSKIEHKRNELANILDDLENLQRAKVVLKRLVRNDEAAASFNKTDFVSIPPFCSWEEELVQAGKRQRK
jgi:hypothetical protein